jgi:eukaryotic-like serine/threonine-protein kinase
MKKLLRTFLLVVFSASLAGLLLLVILNAVVMPRVVDVARVTVPNLRGQSARRAQANLQKWGLKLAYRDSLHHEALPAGTVLGQDPAAGQRIKRRRSISVDVSLGPKYHPVPAGLGGVSLREAQLQLAASQLSLGEIMYVSSTDVPRGAVIRSTPPGGATLARATEVDLEISNGDPGQPKMVPSLAGVPVSQVEDSLRKYEMRLGTIGRVVDVNMLAGIVVQQNPAAATLAPRMSPVDLTVTAAPAPMDSLEQHPGADMEEPP